MSAAYKETLKKIIDGTGLSFDESIELCGMMFGGSLTEAQTAAALAALSARGERPAEIAGFAATMKEHAVRINVEAELDTAGTGGDGGMTFNASTAASLFLAGRLKVLKHGNRAVSSSSGSADFLEALGYNINVGPESAASLLKETGFAFAFAQLYHPAMKALASIRKQLGVRTIFNMLGPLTNPGNVKYSVIGVFSPAVMHKMADAAMTIGIKRAAIIHGEPGIDEVSPIGRTEMLIIDDGRVREMTVEAEDLGITGIKIRDIVVNSPNESAARFIRALRGNDESVLKFTLANAAVAMYVAGVSRSVVDGMQIARQMVSDAEPRLKSIIKSSWVNRA
ncbi:MAG: anthranilate phosphoribosyltransferase [Nitrososphaerota archaeon]|nr:anthranilate phosphoribosyltransferase [Nitrososphaerota archaeon]MDG6930924.1 anthranilate phosphoribosyltransferase [Nitrososphaerota archaeon]